MDGCADMVKGNSGSRKEIFRRKKFVAKENTRSKAKCTGAISRGNK